MKIKVQTVMDATLLISQIIREARPMPQKGKYRLARMHAKLVPEFTIINERRDDMIKAYNNPQMVPNPEYLKLLVPTAENPSPTDDSIDPSIPRQIASKEWTVPLEHLEEFNKGWLEIAAETIELDVEPMSIEQFDLGDAENGVLEAQDIVILGELIA